MNEAANALAILRQKPVGRAVAAAVSSVLELDGHLLAVDANERSISHRFAMYLQETLRPWDVDCEYNRDGVDPKRLQYMDLNPDQEDTEAQTVFPDIVVHRRGTAKNYLVVEIKKSSSRVDRDIDRRKLDGYKRQLGYRFALFLEFGVGKQAGEITAEWIA